MSNSSVVACIASHLDNAIRLKYFGYLIESIIKQEVKPELVLISISTTTKYKKKIKEILNLACKSLNIKYFISLTKKSQFLNYLELLPELESLPQNSWLIFSDDDDLWHPSRVEIYSNAIGFLEQEGKEVKRIACFTNVRNNDEKEGSQIIDSKDVDKFISEKKATCDALTEYLTYAVRSEYFIFFLKWTKRVLLSHRFCDLRFRCYLHHLDKNLLIVDSEENWMYYYRKSSEYDQISSTAPLEELSGEEKSLMIEIGIKSGLLEIPFLPYNFLEFYSFISNNLLAYLASSFGGTTEENFVEYMKEMQQKQSKVLPEKESEFCRLYYRLKSNDLVKLFDISGTIKQVEKLSLLGTKILNFVSSREEKELVLFPSLNQIHTNDSTLVKLNIPNGKGGSFFCWMFEVPSFKEIIRLSHNEKLWFEKVAKPEDEIKKFVTIPAKITLFTSSSDLSDGKTYWLLLSCHTNYKKGRGKFVVIEDDDDKFGYSFKWS